MALIRTYICIYVCVLLDIIIHTYIYMSGLVG